MASKERIEGILDRVRPFLQADGGNIELISIRGNSAEVRLTGICAGCPSAHMTLHQNALSRQLVWSKGSWGRHDVA